MADFSLEPLILQLAEEFKRRDMRSHLASLRAYYRWYLSRKRWLIIQQRPPWTEEMVINWLMIFRLAPFETALPVLASSAPCPQCRHVIGPRDPSTCSAFSRTVGSCAV